jgi:trk system potassium uptake protein TrkH
VQTRLIRDYYVDDVEHEARKIARNILLFTLLTETAGAVALYFRFAWLARGGRVFADGVLFTAIFHSISAFCNAGFSLFSNNLESFGQEPLVLGVVATLIVIGGLGFVVVQDLGSRLRGKSRTISLHSRVVLYMSASLILGGAAVYYLLEGNRALAGMARPYGLLNAVFQSVTTRTAGFNVVDQAALSPASRFFTLLLMFTGGAPGSTAGGVKVTTMFLVLLAILRGTDASGSLNIRRRRIEPETVAQAQLFMLRALALLFASILGLCLSELSAAAANRSFLNAMFESFSAFGTVGLSAGLTPQLSGAGKLIIIFTMFAGRVGLMTIAIARPLLARQQQFQYSSERILVG